MTDPNKKPDDKGKPDPDDGPDAETEGHLPGGDGPPPKGDQP